MHSLNKRILLGITGRNTTEIKKKIKELQKLKIKEASLFVTFLEEKEKRMEIYKALLDAKITKIPLVHIRDECDKSELEFMQKNFSTKYFTIHIKSFRQLKKWKGFHKKLVLELRFHNDKLNNSQFKKIGGFCSDFSHMKASQERKTKEFGYVMKRANSPKLFIGNHLNGYSEKEKCDLHTVSSLKEFDYLKTLPGFVFGKYIALETFNPIREQIKFKKYLCEFLKNY